jgi:hypothetical protein
VRITWPRRDSRTARHARSASRSTTSGTTAPPAPQPTTQKTNNTTKNPTTTSSDEDSGDLATAAAAEAAQAAIGEGDDLGECPFGPIADLAAALPEDLPLADGFDETGTDDGQVFSGGEVDITYCEVYPSSFAEGPIDEIRVDAAPEGDVDVDQYLDEEWTSPSSADVSEADGFAGGDVQVACWDSPQHCVAMWQGEDLFVAVAISGEEDADPDDASAAAAALVPLVVERLAERA